MKFALRSWFIPQDSQESRNNVVMLPEGKKDVGSTDALS